MTWSLTELRAWLDRVEPIAKTRSHFEWLEIAPTAVEAEIQAAYHRVARSRHPDQFRNKLSRDEFDRLVRMYSRVTAAYSDLRIPERCQAYLRTLKPTAAPPRPPPIADDPSHAMNPRALTFYRRAESALGIGDYAGAKLLLHMAIAADTKSPLLRAALVDLATRKP